MSRREWSRRYLRILARRRRAIDAAVFTHRAAVHPAYERWLKARAFGGHRCRPFPVRIGGETVTAMILDEPVAPGPAWQWPVGEGE